MKKLLKDWNTIRVLRVFIGLIVLIQGAYANDKFFIMAGILFTVLPLINKGCCAGSGCSYPKSNNTPFPKKETTYEEVV